MSPESDFEVADTHVCNVRSIPEGNVFGAKNLLCFFENKASLKHLNGPTAVMVNENSQSSKRGKGQTTRLSAQHLRAGGVVGIFGEEAQRHDASIRVVAEKLFGVLKEKFPHLSFRLRSSIRKDEIHKKINAIDPRLGVKLFVPSASIQPDGRVTEVQDKEGNWRVVLVGESKFQGKDVLNIANASRTEAMEKKGQYIMPAGNAIERVHKNIQEMKNFMLGENYFPYVVFLQGSNFATETVTIQWPDGPEISLSSSDSNVNRIDRVTACNYGMDINTNHCRNLIIENPDGRIMLQATSLYAQCDPFTIQQMFDVMLDIALTSLEVLADELTE